MYPACYGDNPRFPHPNDFQVIQKNGSFGQGVICYRRFETGDLVAEFAGEIIHEMTQHSLQIEPGVHLSDLYFAGYFLHSCSPNVYVDMKRRQVHALKPIEPYDFLEMDYAQTEEILFKQFACSCGSPECRGWITGSAETANQDDPAFQEFLRTQRAVA